MKKQIRYLAIIATSITTCSWTFGGDSKNDEAADSMTQKTKSMTCTISPDDVATSTGYVHEAFTGNYGKSLILEGQTPIGSLQFNGPKVFVNFRGAVGVEFLPILTGSKLVPAAQLGIEGNVHQSLLASSLAVSPNVISQLNSYCTRSGLSMDQLQVVLGGYSLGSARATLLAPILRLETEVSTIQCVTYGTLNIFDQTGADNYNSLVGDQNYVGFIAEEDLSRPYLLFSSVGNNILFPAKKSKSYEARVKNGVYTNIPPIFARGLAFFGISIDKWEAHMPTTYLEAIPELYEAARRVKK